MDKKTESNLTIAVAVFSILIILALSFLFYYYAVKSMMFSETASLSGAMGNTKEKESVSWRTKVIVFKPSEVFMQQQKEIGDKIKEYGWSLDGTSEENDMERIANFFLTTYGFTRQNMDMAISFGFEKCKQYGDITKPEREEFYKQIIFLKI